MKNDALVRWNERQGRKAGRKWGTQRLPTSLITVIRAMADTRGISPAEMVTLAFESNPGLAAEFDRTLHPWKGFSTLLDSLQASLPLGLDGKQE